MKGLSTNPASPISDLSQGHSETVVEFAKILKKYNKECTPSLHNSFAFTFTIAPGERFKINLKLARREGDTAAKTTDPVTMVLWYD